MKRSQPPARVPTLTEVLDIAPAIPEPASLHQPTAVAGEQQETSDGEIGGRISSELQAHFDRVLDARLRAALAPLLEQTLTRVIEETRRELTSTLRDGLARALAQTQARHRDGG